MDYSEGRVVFQTQQDWCAYRLTETGSVHKTWTGSSQVGWQHWGRKLNMGSHSQPRPYLQMIPKAKEKSVFSNWVSLGGLPHSGSAPCPGLKEQRKPKSAVFLLTKMSAWTDWFSLWWVLLCVFLGFLLLVVLFWFASVRKHIVGWVGMWEGLGEMKNVIEYTKKFFFDL